MGNTELAQNCSIMCVCRERESGGEPLFYLTNLSDRLSHERSPRNLTVTVTHGRVPAGSNARRFAVSRGELPSGTQTALGSYEQRRAIHRPELLSRCRRQFKRTVPPSKETYHLHAAANRIGVCQC